ncbi:MAG TPA: hypothetical protein VE955_04070, partial [Candidatus Dormibacteraeota bacterium]|nr:hypothetical protein [Candidatus Dormibacteraeota bacterium]
YLNPDATRVCQNCGYALPLSVATEQVFDIPHGVETPAKRGMTGPQKEALLVGAALLTIVIIGVFALASYSPSGTATAPTPPPPPPPPTTTLIHGVIYGQGILPSQNPYQIRFTDLDTYVDYTASRANDGSYSISLSTGAFFAVYCDFVPGGAPSIASPSPFSPSGSDESQDFSC